jgi:uncharacterized membrane protein
MDEMQPLNMLTLLYGVGGLILIGISIPLIRRSIKPNYFYGVRLRQTLENPELWYDANAYFGQRAVISGIVSILIAVLFRLLPGITVDGYATACAIVIVGGLGLTVILTLRYIRTWQGS